MTGASTGPAHCPHPIEASNQIGRHGWHYNQNMIGGPEDWGKALDSRCLGSQQSPIDIKTSSTTHVIKGSKGTRPLKFTNYQQVNGSDFKLINTGFSLGFKMKKPSPSICKIEGAGGPLMSESFHLTQGHFHWGSDDSVGSEHTIDGQSSSLELQLVHLRSALLPFSATSPLDTYDGLVVLSFLFQISSEDNPAFGFIQSKLPYVVDPLTEVDLEAEDLKLWDLISPALNGPYFTYHGSLTTPPCNEVVQYLVYETKLTISSVQLSLLRRINDQNGKPLVKNLRPVQHLGERKVHYFTSKTSR